MLSFYSSTPIYSRHRLSYPDEALAYAPSYSSYFPRVTDPRTRYRRALAEYLAAEDEYNGVLRAREEAVLRARVKAIRQEQARLLQARRLEHALATTRIAQFLPADDLSPPHLVPVVCSPPKQYVASIPDVRASERSPEHASYVDGARFWKELFGSLFDSAHQPEPTVEGKVQPDHSSKENEATMSTLESLLRDRLESTAGDEEVQDVARTILRRLDEQSTSLTGVTESSPAVCPSEPLEGADLSRSDALQGASAEVAKASFKAHRAATLEDPASPVSKTSSSSLKTIQDIHTSLTKLSADFSLPSSLEFSDDEEDGLAYSSINASVRLYEHALDDLLVQLDAVESDGDEEVRELRRSAVKEVEKAIEDVERKVREAKEVAEQGKKLDADVPPAATDLFAQDDEVVGQPESEPAAIDGGKPQEAGPSQLKSGDDCEDEACSSCSCRSSSVSFDMPHIEVVSPDDDNTSPKLDIVSPPTPSLAAEAEFSCVCTNEATGASPEKSPAVTPLVESPAEFATPILGAIAPSSTPVRPPSASPGEGLSVLLLRSEGDDDEWTEV
ncbi:hypothetical protein BGW80DRAFT_1290780 [Lactifluus volemus]|nr:hypothetical protein BGW80DRAFT_1290780 [Lactifluus volemus]